MTEVQTLLLGYGIGTFTTLLILAIGVWAFRLIIHEFEEDATNETPEAKDVTPIGYRTYETEEE